MKLRDYQIRLDEAVSTAFLFEHHAPLVVLPTGGGKTTVFAHITLRRYLAGESVWIVAHRQELINQASETLHRFHVPHGILKAGFRYEPEKRVQVASIQTLSRRVGNLPEPDLIVYDEAHHSVSATYQKVISAYPGSQILGFTATPIRMNGQGLNPPFDTMIVGPTVSELTGNGYLAPARYFAPPVKADLSGLHTVAGDFARDEMESALNKPTITGDAVSHYRNICDGKPMIVFCSSVKHAMDVAAEYRKHGYAAEHVDGSLSDDDRKDRIMGLGTGKYTVLTSCDLIGEGLDVPNVEAVQLLRPTKSLGLHLQMIGRALRPADGKTFAYVLDHVGNVMRPGFGFADDPREWSLSGLVKRKSTGSGPAPLRTCEQCFSAHTMAPKCPYCGFVYPIVLRPGTKVVDGLLVELTKEEMIDIRKTEQRKARTYDELLALARKRGYDHPQAWAMRIFRSRNYVSAMPKK